MIVFIYQKWGREVQAGMGLVFKAGQGEKAQISPVLIPLIISTTWLSHLVGASVGREGVAVQLGASLSHWLKTWFHTLAQRHDNKDWYGRRFCRAISNTVGC